MLPSVQVLELTDHRCDFFFIYFCSSTLIHITLNKSGYIGFITVKWNFSYIFNNYLTKYTKYNKF